MHKIESLSIRNRWVVFPVIYRQTRVGCLAMLAISLVPPATAQQTEQKQEIPDAPSAVHPPQPFPNAAPDSKAAPPHQAPPSENPPPETAAGPASETQQPPRPQMNNNIGPEA